MAAKRRYTDEERAGALAALAANGGNVKKTARQLNIPSHTLLSWSKGVRHREGCNLQTIKKSELAAKFARFVDRVLTLTTDEDIIKTGLKDRFTAAAIATDKGQLLTGEPTEIVKSHATVTTKVDQFAASLASLASSLPHEGGPPGDGPGQPLDTPAVP